MLKRILCALVAAAICSGALLISGGAESPAALSVAADSGLRMENGEIEITPDMNASALLACFNDRASVSLTAPDGTPLSFTDSLSSGATVSCGDDSATVILPGDVNGDGKINTRDVVATLRAIVDPSNTALIPSAANVDRDNPNVNVADVIKIMKKIVGWDVELGSNRAEVAPFEDSDLDIYFTSPMLRVADTDTDIHGTYEGLVRVAKNEIEDAHFIITSTAAKKNLTVEVGDIANEAGDVIDREFRYGYYYSTAMYNDLNSEDYGNTVPGDNAWAEPYPLVKGEISIGAKRSQSFIVKIKTTADTPAGWYSAPVVVKDSAGNEIKRTTLRVYVWDFALNAAPACKTLFGLEGATIRGYFHNFEDEFNPLLVGDWYKDGFYDYVLENRMSAYHLPYSITSPACDQYLDDPRVTAFLTCDSRRADCFRPDAIGATAADLTSTYKKLAKKEEWLEKGYIYGVDEPWGGWEYGLDHVRLQYEGAESILGANGLNVKYKTIVPGGTVWLPELKADYFELCYDQITNFCPGAGNWTEWGDTKMQKEDPYNYPTWGEYQERDQYEKYGNFEARYNKMIEDRGEGDNWWYICIGPLYPYANFFTSYQGAWIRVVFWEQYRYNVDGFLYWHMVYWYQNEGGKYINLKKTSGGDGMLLYPGSLWGEGAVAVPSIRFEQVRDGIEDFQYLTQLEATIGREEAMKLYSNRVATSVIHFSQDYHDIASVRDDMGFALENIGG